MHLFLCSYDIMICRSSYGILQCIASSLAELFVHCKPLVLLEMRIYVTHSTLRHTNKSLLKLTNHREISFAPITDITHICPYNIMSSNAGTKERHCILSLDNVRMDHHACRNFFSSASNVRCSSVIFAYVFNKVSIERQNMKCCHVGRKVSHHLNG